MIYSKLNTAKFIVHLNTEVLHHTRTSGPLHVFPFQFHAAMDLRSPWCPINQSGHRISPPPAICTRRSLLIQRHKFVCAFVKNFHLSKLIKFWVKPEEKLLYFILRYDLYNSTVRI